MSPMTRCRPAGTPFLACGLAFITVVGAGQPVFLGVGLALAGLAIAFRHRSQGAC
ncbi:hypothetical protein [Pseudoxanthomonas suwonensis]|uniref:hypothetical protein n=1 Tax=Pseudoxanthomonas suwonensis TaxID=314722 RepID=UPI000A805B2C|nr:hypothetical protein [Pseudoxanthomonas suwonensis]